MTYWEKKMGRIFGAMIVLWAILAVGFFVAAVITLEPIFPLLAQRQCLDLSG